MLAATSYHLIQAHNHSYPACATLSATIGVTARMPMPGAGAKAVGACVAALQCVLQAISTHHTPPSQLAAGLVCGVLDVLRALRRRVARVTCQLASGIARVAVGGPVGGCGWCMLLCILLWY